MCHDAGGADILSSYIIQNKIKPLLSITGPALKIFENKLGKFSNIKINRIIDEADLFLCGTSWESSIECNLIKESKSIGKKVISYLDHWTNYKQRFIRNNKIYLPDEIWVGDRYAMKIAKENFDNIKIILKKNPLIKYYKDLYKKECQAASVIPNSILFLSDNIEEALFKQYNNKNFWGYNDQDSLKYFIDNCEKLNFDLNRSIDIRLHPSEISRKKWDIKNKKFCISISTEKNLIKDIVKHEVIVGSTSMAMVISLICNKKVICSIPPYGEDCPLPFNKIVMLRNL